MDSDRPFPHQPARPVTRRGFIAGAAASAPLISAAVAAPLLTAACGATGKTAPESSADDANLPPAIRALSSVQPQVQPISSDERRARLARAQQLMAANRLDAIFMRGGTSLSYFTGMNFGGSERTLGMVLPRSGDPVYVTPGFEEGRAREQMRFGHEVRVWQEDESPYQVIAGILADHRASTGALGIEEQVPYFMSTGIGAASPRVTLTSATPVTAGCRSIKSPAELALMELANQTTLACYHAVWQSMTAGMTQQDVTNLIQAAFARQGVHGFVSINVGTYTAVPHGSIEPQKIVEGTVVMLDDGCDIEGYQSDITRTFVLGNATDKMKSVFDVVHKAQAAALAAAHPGAEMGSVDAAARKVIVDAGYGPDYKYFSHRLGHGIGMDGHEWYYLVRGNHMPIQPNMTFSDEPGVYIVGDFGIRLEDDMHIAGDGAHLFTPQSPSLELPFG